MNRTAALALAGALALAAPALPAGASGGTAVDRSAKPLTLAVIGDTPYGAEQEATFDRLVDAIDDDPKVRVVTHVGDIKSGGTACTDERFAAVADGFAAFDDPVVYTPGDNEWTDCHRPAAGGYDPLERLD
ncbi:MAG TPA: metallophosphoesterase, partial [Acidimicrobiales bacterium]|nr:metallophosphoesterase [Acidimicrobiales bacterium]